MTSNAIRSIRRKKSALSEVKIAVIGAPGVGKSGKHMLIVNFFLQATLGGDARGAGQGHGTFDFGTSIIFLGDSGSLKYTTKSDHNSYDKS
ncbi:hypothetical protein CDAR_271571 [Caerostris darwini]|uniref:Uncharacterized protein n=1 Tax=Caerostris darwini TaxID=1538125 RepID=A0AAV4T0B6_9ARAC|nr:hypothetical protein CDAR_271571 [Caerostris darwini]